VVAELKKVIRLESELEKVASEQKTRAGKARK